MKKYLIPALLIIFIVNIYPVKIKIDQKDKTKDQIVLQAILDTGFGIIGVNDGVGVTDYQSYFIKTAFHINDFGIGLDFTIRFKIFSLEPEFRFRDWYIEGDPLSTVFLYLDRIDYIRYGNAQSPVFFTTGKIPYTTFGSGLLVNNFHNNFFVPINKENGAYFRLDGAYFEKYKIKNIPINFTLFCPDLLDPDIFGFDFNINPLGFTKFKDVFKLSFGLAFMSDLDTFERNRLSALKGQFFQSHRNFDVNGFSSTLIAGSIPISFEYFKKDYVKVSVVDEVAFAYNGANPSEPDKSAFGVANNLEVEARFLNVKNSGLLLGISAGFIVQGEDFFINYFSSNYQIVRQKQYSGQSEVYNLYASAGFGLYALNDNLHFKFKILIPLITDVFKSKYIMEFRLSEFAVKGLTIDVFYETGCTDLHISGANGGHFLESITENFRFYAEVSYKIYSAKISFIIGLQTPGWIIEEDYLPPENPNEFYIERYGADIQKFVGVGVSFVL